MKYFLLVPLGNADHVADDLQRQWSGKLGNQFPFAVGMRGDHRVDEATCAIAHRCLGTGDHLRRERSADDVAQPLMPRVVERDHRSEELRDFGREVVDPDVGIRAIDVRMTAGEVDIVELRHHPVAGALLEPGRCRLAPERDRRLAPQRGEGPIADIVVFQPELPGAEIDIGKRNLGRSHAVHPRRTAHDDHPHFNEGATIGERNGKRLSMAKTLRLLQLRQDAMDMARNSLGRSIYRHMTESSQYVHVSSARYSSRAARHSSRDTTLGILIAPSSFTGRPGRWARPRRAPEAP